MEALQGRYDIAQALNFGKYPVVLAEARVPTRFEELVLGRVRIETGRGYFLRARLFVFADDMKLVPSSPGSCLTARFALEDLLDDAEWAMCPVLRPQSAFILVLFNKHTRKAGVFKFETGDVDPNCSTPLEIKDNYMGTLLECLCDKTKMHYFQEERG